MAVLSLEDYEGDKEFSAKNQDVGFDDGILNSKNWLDFTHEDYLNYSRKRAFYVIKEQSLLISKKATIMKEDFLVSWSYIEIFDWLFEVQIVLDQDWYAQITTWWFFYSERNKITKSKRVRIVDIDFAVNRLSAYFQELSMKEIDSSHLTSVLDTIEILLNPQSHIFQ